MPSGGPKVNWLKDLAFYAFAGLVIAVFGLWGLWLMLGMGH